MIQKIKRMLAAPVAWCWLIMIERSMEIERIIVIVLLVSTLLFGIADWLGLFGAGCTCR